MDGTWLTYREAARRVGRSVRTIRRWKRNGMQTVLRDGRRYVEEETLLAWWRDRMTAWPPHQYRIRAKLRHAEGKKSSTSTVTP